MESLTRGEIQAFLEDREGQRNGYYDRDIGTRYGRSKISGFQETETMNFRQPYLKGISAISE
jgi:hypothetical protein